MIACGADAEHAQFCWCCALFRHCTNDSLWFDQKWLTHFGGLAKYPTLGERAENKGNMMHSFSPSLESTGNGLIVLSVMRTVADVVFS